MTGSLFGTQVAASQFRGNFPLGAQLASLFVTGCVVRAVVLALEPGPIPAGVVFALSLGAWLVSSGAFAGLHFLFAEPFLARTWTTLLRTSAAAAWLTPTAILVAGYSPAAVAAALILIVCTTRVLYLECRSAPVEPEPPLGAPDAGNLFEDYSRPSPALYRQLAPALALALLIHAATVAAMMRYPLLAAASCALMVAFLTVYGMAAGVIPRPKPRGLRASAIASLLTALLAAGWTQAGGQIRWAPLGYRQPADLTDRRGRGLLRSAEALLSHSLYDRKPPGAPKPPAPMALAAPHYRPASSIGKTGDNDFPGVVLWPEVRPETMLVSPVLSGTTFSGRATDRLGIPFSGEYWMFRAPYTHPPDGSFFQRGSPVSLAFNTTDHRPLEMEAHHKLDQPIDPRCCREIQVTIWNADHYPGTVALELILIDRARWGRLSQTLGTTPVTSSPGSLPVRETLDFPIPAAPALQQFDEFKILFHRNHSRIDKSAQIEIDRFVLVPLGSL